MQQLRTSTHRASIAPSWSDGIVAQNVDGSSVQKPPSVPVVVVLYWLVGVNHHLPSRLTPKARVRGRTHKGVGETATCELFRQ
eukprot:1984201-Amphidinium_carterae.1